MVSTQFPNQLSIRKGLRHATDTCASRLRQHPEVIAACLPFLTFCLQARAQAGRDVGIGSLIGLQRCISACFGLRPAAPGLFGHSNFTSPRGQRRLSLEGQFRLFRSWFHAAAAVLLSLQDVASLENPFHIQPAAGPSVPSTREKQGLDGLGLGLRSQGLRGSLLALWLFAGSRLVSRGFG